jgi:hypothetical protein
MSVTLWRQRLWSLWLEGVRKRQACTRREYMNHAPCLELSRTTLRTVQRRISNIHIFSKFNKPYLCFSSSPSAYTRRDPIISLPACSSSLKQNSKRHWPSAEACYRLLQLPSTEQSFMENIIRPSLHRKPWPLWNSKRKFRVSILSSENVFFNNFLLLLCNLVQFSRSIFNHMLEAKMMVAHVLYFARESNRLRWQLRSWSSITEVYKHKMSVVQLSINNGLVIDCFKRLSKSINWSWLRVSKRYLEKLMTSEWGRGIGNLITKEIKRVEIGRFWDRRKWENTKPLIIKFWRHYWPAFRITDTG